MLSVLLNVTSPVSLSALTGLDTSRLHSEGFDRLVADAQQLREQAGSSDLLLWILVGIFVVEALLMMVLFAVDSAAFATCVHDAQGGPHGSAERVQSFADGDGSSGS